MPIGDEYLNQPFSATSLSLIGSLRESAEPLAENVDMFGRSVDERKDNHLSLSYELDEGEVALFGVRTAWILLDASQKSVHGASDALITSTYKVDSRVKRQRQTLQLLDSRFHIPSAHRWVADLLIDAADHTDRTAKLLRGQLVYMIGQDQHDAMGRALIAWEQNQNETLLREFRGQVNATSPLIVRTAPSLIDWMREVTQENRDELDEAYEGITSFANRYTQ
jgi:hypothetical protein